ncbi:MAG TPA: LLM class flavin-dependent oxidoreductase [Thermomicrobiales bacterium]|nr:LLM class flavin-dependent oxidoreductase [Thermomicrobiales bacterium]
MRLALETGPELWRTPDGVAKSVELAQLAEQLGFDSIWASEDPDGWDAFSALTVLARATERLHLGTGVTNPYYRHPNLISASVATLDRASDGRAFLGLGRGEPDWYRTAFGMELGSPLEHVRETVDLLRQWWGPDQTANSDGEITVRSWRREFSPLGNPPIYLAATGRKMQALAGRIADGLRLNALGSLPFLRRSVETFLDSARSVNHDPADLRIFANPGLTVTATDAEIEPALERKKTTVALIHALPGMEQQLEGLEAEFDLEAILARVRRHMRTEEILARGGSFADLRREGDLDAARKAIPLELVDRVAVVGPPERVLPRLTEYAELGITDIFATPRQLQDDQLRIAIRSL